jgi:pilus assembly protein Flp/PilA
MLLNLIAYIQAAKHAFKEDIKGATAIEYGLIAGGISLAIVTAVFLFGDELSSLFSTIAGKMEEAGADVQADLG